MRPPPRRPGRRADDPMRLAPLLLAIAAACTAPEPGPQAFALPPELREVSGLAAAGPGRVLAHDDEQAAVHEIDVDAGRTVRSFSLGGMRGDYEGIAVAGDRLFLIDSGGTLLAAPLGADGPRVPFVRHDTGADCEVEGLANGPVEGTLLILCKTVRGRTGMLRVYSWPTGGGEARLWLDLDLSERQAGLAPSGIERIAGSGMLLVLSARTHSMLVLDAEGGVLGTIPLPAGRHPQPEGIALLPDGRLAVADEGGRGGPGRLTLYSEGHLRQVLNRFDSTSRGVATSSKNPER